VDITFLNDQLALGDGIWTADRMAMLAAAGFTHIVDLQAEFDDTELGRQFGLEVLWNATLDDFQPKDAAFFQRSVNFALAALREPENRVYVHCAAGVHRAPLTAAALLCHLGYDVESAIVLIRRLRPIADFPAVYVDSLRAYVESTVVRDA